MRPEVPADLLRQAAQWSDLHRHQRRELGRALRRLGLAYREIRELIPVPKSTLATWCTDTKPSDVQAQAIRDRTRSQKGVPKNSQWRRHVEIGTIRRLAGEFATEHLGDPFFVSGVILYWAEGSKTQSDLNLANTDPALLRLFITWVRDYLDERAEFRLSLHLHRGNNEEEAKRFWRRELGLPTARFTRTYIKRPGTGHRKNHLTHGVCRVRVCRSTNHWHMTMAWIEHIRDQHPPRLATLAPGR